MCGFTFQGPRHFPRPFFSARACGYADARMRLYRRGWVPDYCRGGARLLHSGEKTRPSSWWPKIGVLLYGGRPGQFRTSRKPFCDVAAKSPRCRYDIAPSSARCRSVRAPLRAHRPTTKRPGNEATLCMLEPRIVSPSECVTTILMDLCSVHPYNRTFRTSLLRIASSHYIMFRPLWSSYCSCRIIPHDFL